MATNNKLEHHNELVDVEAYAKEGKKVPAGQHYNIMVDRQKFTVMKECLTGREILELAGKNPYQRFQLNVRLKGAKVVKVGYEQVICLTEPGLEKFMTIPLDQTEG